MRADFLRRNGIEEAHAAVLLVGLEQGAGNGVDQPEGFFVGRAIRLPGAAENLNRGRFPQVLAGQRIARRREDQRDPVARLLGAQVGDGRGDRRLWRLRLARRAAPGRNEQNQMHNAKAGI